uniref:MADF domain-containing protein n=1 Tax=Steinernema glaseri TaxID=37863 RepID=A0A1I7XYI0_9BILA
MQHPPSQGASQPQQQQQNQAPPLNNSSAAKVVNSNEVCTSNGIKSPGSVSSEGHSGGEKAITDDVRFAIIDAVYLRPAIWDSCGRQAKSLCERKNLFGDIAKMLSSQTNPLSATDIEKQWKNLKDTYNKVKKKISVDDNGCMIPPRWRFFNAMLFLDHQTASSNDPYAQQQQQQQSSQQGQNSQLVQGQSGQVVHNNNLSSQQQPIVVMAQEHHHSHLSSEESRKRPYGITVDGNDQSGPHKLSAMDSTREHVTQTMQIINLVSPSPLLRLKEGFQEGRTLTNLSTMPTTSLPHQAYLHPAQIPVSLSQQQSLLDAHHAHIPVPVHMVSAAELVSSATAMPTTSLNHTLVPNHGSDTSTIDSSASTSTASATTSTASNNNSEDEYDAFCRSLAYPLREIGTRNRVEFLRLQKAIQDQIFEKQMATLAPQSQQQNG